MKITIDYEGDNQGTRFMQTCMETGISYLVESYDWTRVNLEKEEDGRIIIKFERRKDDSHN